LPRLLRYFLAGILVTALPLSAWTVFLSKKTEILSSQTESILTSTTSPTPTPSPSPTPDPTTTPTPTPTPKPATPTPVPLPAVSSQEINGFIDQFATQYNVDPNLLRHIAICESGFNPLSKNGPYAGLYQFGPTTWQNYRVKLGEDINTNLRLNAQEAVQTAAYVLSINQAYIWPNCVR